MIIHLLYSILFAQIVSKPCVSGDTVTFKALHLSMHYYKNSQTCMKFNSEVYGISIISAMSQKQKLIIEKSFDP